MDTCLPACLTRNAVNRSRYIGLFTTAAATVSVSLLTWAVLNDSREGADTDPLVQAALEEQQIIETIALVVNIGWLIVAILLVIAVKKLSPGLMVPFLVQTALYVPFCLGVTAVCARRMALLRDAGRGQSLLPTLVSSVVMCIAAPAVYCVLALVVAAGRQQMMRGDRSRRLSKE